MSQNTIVENANKIGFLVNNYPKKTLNEIINMLDEMSPLDINCALWMAQDLKLMGTPDIETGVFERLPAPESYNWGPGVTQLIESIGYAFHKLAEKESDLEENFFSSWTSLHPGHEVIIAMKHLENTNIIAEYVIQDFRLDEKGNKMYDEDENTPLMDDYTFYTLYENADKMWGQKNFKINPLTGELNNPEETE